MEDKTERAQRAARALAMMNHGQPEWDSFLRAWIGFNAVYNEHPDRTERDRVMAAVRAGFTDEEAGELLGENAGEITELLALPPGDMRLGPRHARFRQKSTADAAVVSDETAPGRERLAHLMAVVYLVRCNLVHGDKDPRAIRDRALVRASDVIVRRVVERLLVFAQVA